MKTLALSRTIAAVLLTMALSQAALSAPPPDSPTTLVGDGAGIRVYEPGSVKPSAVVPCQACGQIKSLPACVEITVHNGSTRTLEFDSTYCGHADIQVYQCLAPSTPVWLYLCSYPPCDTNFPCPCDCPPFSWVYLCTISFPTRADAALDCLELANGQTNLQLTSLPATVTYTLRATNTGTHAANIRLVEAGLGVDQTFTCVSPGQTAQTEKQVRYDESYGRHAPISMTMTAHGTSSDCDPTCGPEACKNSSVTVSFPSNLPPVVSNVTACQRGDGSGVVDIYYDVTDPDSAACDIKIQVSHDGGASYSMTPVHRTGDVGTGIPIGTGKHVEWEAIKDLPNANENNASDCVVAVTATDSTHLSHTGYSNHFAILTGEIQISPSQSYTRATSTLSLSATVCDTGLSNPDVTSGDFRWSLLDGSGGERASGSLQYQSSQQRWTAAKTIPDLPGGMYRVLYSITTDRQRKGSCEDDLAVPTSAPEVLGVTAQQRSGDTKVVDISYEAEDADSPTVSISLQYTRDGDHPEAERRWMTNPTCTGDIGQVSTGEGRQIEWHFANELAKGETGSNYMVRVIASDGYLEGHGDSGTFPIDNRDAEPPPQTGKLRFYIDCDGSGAYEAAGDPPDKLVRCVVLIEGRQYETDENGILPVSLPSTGDCGRIVAMTKEPIFWYPAVRDNHECVGSRMFELYFDTYTINDNGPLEGRKLEPSELATLRAGGEVRVALTHPLFKWNLVVACAFNAMAETPPGGTQTYYQELETGLRIADRYLFDVTDGHMKLGKIVVYSNASRSTLLWRRECDVRIYNDQRRPATGWWGGVESWLGETQVFLPKWAYRPHIPSDLQPLPSQSPSGVHYATTLVHELGHYLLALDDEYINGLLNESLWRLYRDGHHDEVPDNYGLMDTSAGEMSSYNDYLNSYTTYRFPCVSLFCDAYRVTAQLFHYSLWNGSGVHKPCWQLFIDRFDNSGGTQSKWRGYDRTRVKLSPPPDFRNPRGSYQLVSGKEKHEPEDRRSGEMPTFYEPCEVVPGDVGYAATDSRAVSSSRPYTGAVSVSETGLPLLLEAWPSPNADGSSLQLRLILGDVPLDTPTMTVSPCFGSPQSISLVAVGPRVFEGIANLGDCEAGDVQVIVQGVAGTTHCTTSFTLQRAWADRPTSLQCPSGLLSVNVLEGVLPADTSAIVIGASTMAIAPSDPNLVLATEPVAFHISRDVPAGSVYTLNWHLEADELLGRDAGTLSLRRFDEQLMDWVEVDADSAPGYPVISASNVAEGIYAVFARESSDTTPPAQITDLTAQSGGEGWAVSLQWTAPGDDGASGQAVRHHVLFSKDPITEENAAGCPELPMFGTPEPAGQVEQYSFEMPDPDTHYYFAVIAEDEAGNRGPLSNIADARSYAKDTDADGMPDQWEEAYELDPSDAADRLLDPDEDGLTNLQEYQARTCPTNRDTDGDDLSDGLEVASSTSPLDAQDPKTGTAASAKQQQVGDKIGCSRLIVTASSETFSYGQDEDGAAGIKLEGIVVPVGRIAEVIGTVTVNSSGEACLTQCQYRSRWEGSADPVELESWQLGGGPFGLQEGMPGSSDPNNIGRLVRYRGEVTQVGAGYVYVDDGWTVVDGTLTGSEDSIGVRVACDSVRYVSGDNVVITGISSCFRTPSDDLARLVLPATPSDIVVVGEGVWFTNRIRDAKAQADGAAVILDALTVTASFADFFYVEDDGRTCGIRVAKPGHGAAQGSRVFVRGHIRTLESGERYVDADVVRPAGTGAEIRPFTMRSDALGGEAWSYNPLSGAGQRGVSNGVGLNNVGLLVSVSGMVTTVGDGYAYVDDGVNLADETYTDALPNVGVRVACDTSNCAIGDYVAVKGISSCFRTPSGKRAKLVRARETDGITTYPLMQTLCSSIGELKYVGLHRRVLLESAVVTATGSQVGGSLYVEDPGRSCGIRVQSNAQCEVGDVVGVSGILEKAANGELQLASGALTHVSHTNPLKPLAMKIMCLGGEPHGLQEGVTGGSGLNTIGLLVTTWGSIGEIEDVIPPAAPAWFRIQDGDYSAKCLLPAGVTLNSGWHYAVVTGISSLEKVGGDMCRTIRVRSQDDLAGY